MIQPDTCGTAGGAISVWVNVVDVRVGGIISSYLTGKSGVRIYCTSQEIRYENNIMFSLTNATKFSAKSIKMFLKIFPNFT